MINFKENGAYMSVDEYVERMKKKIENKEWAQNKKYAKPQAFIMA